jgi:hypothetical protein
MSWRSQLARSPRLALRLLPRRGWKVGRMLQISFGPSGLRASFRPSDTLSVYLAPGRRPVASLKLPLLGRLTLPARGPHLPGWGAARQLGSLLADQSWTRRAEALPEALPGETRFVVRWSERAQVSPGWYDPACQMIHLSRQALRRDGERVMDLVLRHLLVHAVVMDLEGDPCHGPQFAELAARIGPPIFLPGPRCVRTTMP